MIDVAAAFHALADHFHRTGHHDLADTLTEAAGGPSTKPAPASPDPEPPAEPVQDEGLKPL